MREIVLEARAVTRTYGTGTGATHALRGVDVEIEQGRFTAIIGASGCGKSTLLQALGGLDAPTSGKVLLEGQDLYALPDAALARLRRTRLGFVFQAFHLLPEYTVRDNILLPLLLGIDGIWLAVTAAPKRQIDRHSYKTAFCHLNSVKISALLFYCPHWMPYYDSSMFFTFVHIFRQIQITGNIHLVLIFKSDFLDLHLITPVKIISISRPVSSKHSACTSRR